MEGHVSTVEDEMAPLMRDVKHCALLTAQHASRIDDMENQLRRNNVHAKGIPERAEGKNPVVFIENWLLSNFGKESFSSMFFIEQAYRVPIHPIPAGSPPRTFLF